MFPIYRKLFNFSIHVSEYIRVEFTSLSNLKSLQGKYPLAEVIKEVFSVIKLTKIVKKTFATTSVYGYRGLGGAFNGN